MFLHCFAIVKLYKTLYTINDASLFTGGNADRKTYVGDRFSAQGAALEQALPFLLRYYKDSTTKGT